MIPFDIIPASVVRLCERLEQAGFEAHLVGGGVRDMLLRRPVHDWDLATSALPEQVQRICARTIPTGIKHGTVTVLTDHGKLPVEVTTYRGEGAYSDGRHPDSVTFVRSLEEDLKRRDFTINAMALDPLRRRLVDPLCGAADIDARQIRAVGEAEQRFAEDSLRMMRAVRFAAVLEFPVEPQTLAAIPRCLPRLRLVSAERIRDELLKTLEARRPSVGLELMGSTGLMDEVLPELAAGRGLTQNRYHTEDVYRHSLSVCDATEGDAVLRLAALLHDVGKVETAAPHPGRPGEMMFHGHESVSAKLCEQICRRLKLSNAQRERVCHLVAHHMFPLDGWSAAGMRRFLRRVGPEHVRDLLALKAADISGKQQHQQRQQKLQQLRQALAETSRRAPPLSTSELAINGRDLMQQLQLQPGPIIGKLMRALLERVLEQPELNTRARLLDDAQKLLGTIRDAGPGRKP